MPEDILHDAAIGEAMKQLPSNYNFEIRKSIWKIRAAGAKRVALQFPEGLLLYACLIADMLTQFTGAECIIMGDVTFGACCVDDLGAAALGADFMIHYGHSCLVPIDQTTSTVKMLYVFVDIAFDISHVRLRAKAACPSRAHACARPTYRARAHVGEPSMRHVRLVLSCACFCACAVGGLHS